MCVCACMCACVSACVCACVRACVRACICSDMHMYACVSIIYKVTVSTGLFKALKWLRCMSGDD